jgi:hypothetical protein
METPVLCNIGSDRLVASAAEGCLPRTIRPVVAA